MCYIHLQRDGYRSARLREAAGAVSVDDAAKRIEKLHQLLEREKEDFLTRQHGGATKEEGDNKAKKAKSIKAYTR